MDTEKEAWINRSKNILIGMANNIDFASIVIRSISKHKIGIVFFNKDHLFIFNEMREAYMKDQTFSKAQIIAATYQKYLNKNTDELKQFRKFISEEIFQEINIDKDIKWYLKIADEQIKKAMYRELLMFGIQEQQNNKDSEEVLDRFGNKFEECLKEGIEENDLWDASEHFPEVHDYLTAEHQTITTGIDGLDYSMWGGWRKKTLNVICAGTGIGKSFFMTNNACAAIRNGNNVMYITMEMTKEDVVERISQNLLGMTRNDIKQESKEKFEEEMTLRLDTSILYVEEMKKGTSAYDIKAKIKKVTELKKKQIDIVFIDYLGYMGENYKKGENTYIKYQTISEELHEMSKQLNIPVITAMQLTRHAGKDGKEPGLEDIADSHGVSKTADNVIVLYYNSPETQQNVNKEGQGEIKLKHEKRRRGGRGGIYYTCLINLYNQKMSEKLDNNQQSNQTESHSFTDNNSGFPDDSINDWDIEKTLVHISSDNTTEVPF